MDWNTKENRHRDTETQRYTLGQVSERMRGHGPTVWHTAKASFDRLHDEIAHRVEVLTGTIQRLKGSLCLSLCAYAYVCVGVWLCVFVSVYV